MDKEPSPFSINSTQQLSNRPSTPKGQTPGPSPHIKCTPQMRGAPAKVNPSLLRHKLFPVWEYEQRGEAPFAKGTSPKQVLLFACVATINHTNRLRYRVSIYCEKRRLSRFSLIETIQPNTTNQIVANNAAASHPTSFDSSRQVDLAMAYRSVYMSHRLADS